MPARRKMTSLILQLPNAGQQKICPSHPTKTHALFLAFILSLPLLYSHTPLTIVPSSLAQLSPRAFYSWFFPVLFLFANLTSSQWLLALLTVLPRATPFSSPPSPSER